MIDARDCSNTFNCDFIGCPGGAQPLTGSPPSHRTHFFISPYSAIVTLSLTLRNCIYSSAVLLTCCVENFSYGCCTLVPIGIPLARNIIQYSLRLPHVRIRSRYVRKVRGSGRRAFIFSVRRTHRELNEAPKHILKKVRLLHTVSCAWTTGGRIVCLFEDGRKVTVLHERDVDMAETSLTLLLKLPGQTRTMWSYNVTISYIHDSTLFLPTAETDTRTEISAGAVHDTKYLSVKHFSLHLCRDGTCRKVSFRQQEFTL